MISVLADEMDLSSLTSNRIYVTFRTQRRYAREFSNDKPGLVRIIFAISPVSISIQHFNFTKILKKLMDDLEISAANADGLMEPVVENSPCLAWSSVLQLWCRAQIKLICDDDAVGVVFVDYGYQEKFFKCNVKMLEKRFADLPFLAPKVKLDVYPPGQRGWTEDVRQEFKDMVESKVYHMEVIRSEQDLMVVRLFDMNSNRSVVGTDLVSKLVNI